jgi:hypothetical protein
MSMLQLLSYPDFAGHRYSRTSSTVSVDNTLNLEGVLELTAHRKLTPGKTWGRRAKPQARTRGKFEPDAKMKLYLEDYNLLIAYLEEKGAAVLQGSFEVQWQLTCTLFEAGLGTTRWDILGCRIMDESVEPALDGDDKQIEVSLDLDVMDILKDGKSVVMETSPFGQIGSSL